MKIVLILILVAACYALPDEDKWEKFKVKFNKEYSTKGEEQMRKYVFYENLKLMKEQNKNNHAGSFNWLAEVNEFSDKSPKEVAKMKKVLC